MNFRVLSILFLSAVCAATAIASYPNNYAAYQTESFDPTLGLVVNVTITGTALPPVPNMPGAYHRGQVNLIFNGGSNWEYGNNVCTTCNVNFNGNWSFSQNDTCFLDLIGCTLETTPQVSCSVIGVFWQAPYGSGGTSNKYVEWASTTEKKNGAGTYYPNQGVWEYPAIPWCKNGTPDISETPILDDSANAANNDYWLEKGLAIRLSTSSTFTLIGHMVTTNEYTGIPNPADFACTHNGPQK